MTISGLTVAAASTGVNASVAPAAPSGLAAGDLVIIFASIRATAATVNLPAGWTRLSPVSDNAQIFGRFWQAGDAMPTIAFTGGVANADTYARALKMTGAGLDTLTELAAVQLSNVSAQNIAYPALNLPGPNCLAIMALWKQDDATSLGTPAGWTAQGHTNMTTGDDMLSAWFTQLQTTEVDVIAGSVTVTGGVAAVSKGLMLAIKPAPTLTVTEVDLFPPRTLITVNGLTPGDDVNIYRVVAGERTLIRGGALTGATDPAFVVVDGELPFGIPMFYEAVVNGTATYASASDTYTLVGGKVVLSDAVTGDAAEFVIVAWDEKEYDRQASVFKVGGRNVVVVGELGMFESTMEIYFSAYSSTENFKALLNSATEGVLQLRRPSLAYDGVDCYVAVVSAREKRFSQDGSDPRRTWTLELAETESWSSGQVSKTFTLQDLADVYTGQTLSDLAGDYSTLLALAQADLS